jgi:hypothetical protein
MPFPENEEGTFKVLTNFWKGQHFIRNTWSSLKFQDNWRKFPPNNNCKKGEKNRKLGRLFRTYFHLLTPKGFSLDPS